MIETTSDGEIPRPVMTAALLMWAYALWVIGSMVWFLATGGELSGYEASRAGLRFGGIVMVGLSLFTLKNVAWWTAILISGCLSALGVVGIAALSVATLTFDEGLWRACLQLLPGVGFLGGAASVLARRDTRDLFS